MLARIVSAVCGNRWAIGKYMVLSYLASETFHSPCPTHRTEQSDCEAPARQ